MFELWYSMKNSIITPIKMRRNSTVEKFSGGIVWSSFSLMFEELDWSNSTQEWSHFEMFLNEKKENCFRGVSLPKSFQQCEWVVGFLCRPIWEATSHKLINLLLRSIGTNLRVFLQKNSSLKPPNLSQLLLACCKCRLQTRF